MAVEFYIKFISILRWTDKFDKLIRSVQFRQRSFPIFYIPVLVAVTVSGSELNLSTVEMESKYTVNPRFVAGSTKRLSDFRLTSPSNVNVSKVTYPFSGPGPQIEDLRKE